MQLIWLDLETTGLNPQHDVVLEVAVAKADLLDPFHVRHAYSKVVWFPPRPNKLLDGASSELAEISWRWWKDLSPFIVDMHTRNGLLDECSNGAYLADVEQDLLGLVPQVDDKEELPVLAGSSIHFDHAFIKFHMPRFAERLSHRHYDVSGLKLFCQSMGMPKFPKANAHRAKDDIDESVAHGVAATQWLRDNLR